jgi:hypothetical protein
MDVPPGPMDVPEAAAVRAVAQSSVSRPSITAAETAVVCYLREHKDVAKTYGIKKVDGNTSVGSMLVQTLEEQGMGVEWYDYFTVDGGYTAPRNAHGCTMASASWSTMAAKHDHGRVVVHK